jgi:hypothetical protein
MLKHLSLMIWAMESDIVLIFDLYTTEIFTTGIDNVEHVCLQISFGHHRI